MKLLLALTLAALSCLFSISWYQSPSKLMNQPIQLDSQAYADKFGGFLQTLTPEQKQKLGSYIDRADYGQLNSHEQDWRDHSVTPKQVIEQY